jgi:hypothetical protein
MNAFSGRTYQVLITIPLHAMRSYFHKCLPLLFAIFLLSVTQSTEAGIRPSFWLDSCTWDATHIVLVATTSQGDVFTVMQSWKGDLKARDTLKVPELKPDSDAVAISRYPAGEAFDHIDESGISGRVPNQPVGSQMVLFLKSRKEKHAASQATNIQASGQWKPASLYGGMKVSVVWIDGGQLFCFQQQMNPGPSALGPCTQRTQMDLPMLIGRIKDILQTQDHLARLPRLEDRNARMEQLQTIIYGDVWYGARKAALQGLGKTGPSALPVIQQMLDRPPVPYDSEDLVKALAQAAGEDAGNELNRRLRQNLDFWRSRGHSLKNGWWNEDPAPDAPLRVKYDETIELIRVLDHERFRPAIRPAAELRDFWLSLPQLNDPSGLNQLAEECDHLVKHLSAK